MTYQAIITDTRTNKLRHVTVFKYNGTLSVMEGSKQANISRLELSRLNREFDRQMKCKFKFLQDGIE
jgi:hypothetical protein